MSCRIQIQMGQIKLPANFALDQPTHTTHLKHAAQLTLTSASKVPSTVSYLRRWPACLTPPESFSATISMLVSLPL